MAEKRQTKSTSSSSRSSSTGKSSAGKSSAGKSSAGKASDSKTTRSSSRSGRARGESGGGLLAAPQELFERMQTLTEAVVTTGTDAIGKVAGPLPGAASDMLTTLRTLIVEVPSPTAPLDLIVEEVKAKRAMVQAMIVQLESFDSQLEILERSLTPLQEWGAQWAALQSSVLEPLRPRR